MKPGAAPEAAAGADAGTPDGGWLRVHPASPFVRGWVALAAIVFFFFLYTFQLILQGGPLVDEQLAGRAPWLLLGGGVLLLLTGAGYILSWYFTRYQVAEGYVRINTGFLFKQQRQARLDRVQAIDIVQPLLARICGLAELKFEVADAGESAVRLAYLRMDEARQLRATILARAAGVVPDPARPGEAAAARPAAAPHRFPCPERAKRVYRRRRGGFRGAFGPDRKPQLLPLPDPGLAGHGGRVLERHQPGL